jgi:hypothetical protein
MPNGTDAPGLCRIGHVGKQIKLSLQTGHEPYISKIVW